MKTLSFNLPAIKLALYGNGSVERALEKMKALFGAESLSVQIVEPYRVSYNITFHNCRNEVTQIPLLTD